jgi:hypothetical protein
MRRLINLQFTIALLLLIVKSGVYAGEPNSPTLSDFLMERDYEIALARSAAPDRVSKEATILVLGRNGYEKVIDGSNSFVCLVIRSWGNPTYDHAYIYLPDIVVPECLDPNAVRTILPMQLFRAELGAKMTAPAEIEAAVKERFRNGQFKRTEAVSFSYMMSAAMTFGNGHQGPAHIMIYLPDNYSNDTVGGFPFKDLFLIVEGGPDQPFVAANIYLIDKAIGPVFD